MVRSKPPSTIEERALNKLLKTWGMLTCLEYNASVGTSSMYRFSKLGINLSGQRQNNRWTQEAELIDALINQLYQAKPKWAKAIQYRYTKAGDIRQQANQLGLAKSTYHEQIQHGRGWLANQLKSLQ